MGKSRYISKEEKEKLPKNEKWANLGKSILKAGALTAGGVAGITASAFVGAPLVCVSALVVFTLCRPAYTNVIMNFVDLFTKEKENSKGR